MKSITLSEDSLENLLSAIENLCAVTSQNDDPLVRRYSEAAHDEWLSVVRMIDN